MERSNSQARGWAEGQDAASLSASAPAARLACGTWKGSSSGNHRFAKALVTGVAAWLGLTGAVKLLSVLQETRVLGAADPLLPWLAVRQLLFLAAVLELGAAVILLRHLALRWTKGLVLYLVAVPGFDRPGRTPKLNGGGTARRQCSAVINAARLVRCALITPSMAIPMSATLLSQALQLQGGEFSSSQQGDAGELFRAYMAETPPIKHIVFDHWFKAKYGPDFFRAEGAFQPRGYYLLYPSNSAFTSNIWVSGLSDQYEWSYVRDYESVSYGPKEFWDKGPKAMNWTALNTLRAAICLGMPHLPGEFKWTSTNEFEFTNRWEWYKEPIPNGLKYHGRILRWDARGRPKEIEMRDARRGERPQKIVYFYDDQGFLPTRIDMVAFKRDKRPLHGTTRFLLHKLDIGLDPKAVTGYKLKDFLTSADLIKEIYFISNQVSYYVLPDGTHRPVKYSQPPADPRMPQRITIAAFVISFACLAIYWIFRIRGKPKPKTITSTTGVIP